MRPSSHMQETQNSHINMHPTMKSCYWTGIKMNIRLPTTLTNRPSRQLSTQYNSPSNLCMEYKFRQSKGHPETRSLKLQYHPSSQPLCHSHSFQTIRRQPDLEPRQIYTYSRHLGKHNTLASLLLKNVTLNDHLKEVLTHISLYALILYD